MTDPRPVSPVPGPIDVTVRLPGSKSETIRALAAAALASGRSHLYGGLAADDPAAMAGALDALGVSVLRDGDPWAVDGTGGRLGRPDGPLDLNESGLSARIVMALASMVDGPVTLTGRGRLPERPMTGLVATLRALGVEVDFDHLPMTIVGRGRLWGGVVEIDCSETSQYATALMLAAPTMEEPCDLEITGLEGSAGYLEVTAAMMRRFGADVTRALTGYHIENGGYTPSDVVIEPDASAAVYPMVAAAITGGRAVISGLGSESRQPDMRIAHVLGDMGCRVDWLPGDVTIEGRGSLEGVDVDMSDAPDGAMSIALAALFADGESTIRGLASLRLKESDRLAALSEEISKLGGVARVEGDSLVIAPCPLSGAVVDSHGDHRIAMTMALAGLVVPGVAVVGPGAVTKTWPGYWAFLDSLS